MGIIVNNTDFVGKFQIAQNCYSELNDYIETYERKYLEDLLGCDLTEDLIGDLNNQTPQTQKFIDIFERFCEDDGICINRSEGIKSMLLGFIYFEYVRDVAYKVTVGGVKRNRVEVSGDVGTNQHNIYNRFNWSIETFNSIQHYICDRSSDFMNFNGQNKQITHWAI